MMRRNARLKQIFRALSVTRRACAVVRREKRGRDTDVLYQTTPRDQLAAFLRAMALRVAIRFLEISLFDPLVVQVEVLRAHMAHRHTLRLSQIDREIFADFIRTGVGE